jgi:hypothetical protein
MDPKTEFEIQREVQAQVEFKMNELLTGMKNVAMINWEISFLNNSVKHCHYWEAFEQMTKMLNKEMHMGTPIDNVAALKRREKKNKAVEKIIERLRLRGTKDWQYTERFLSDTIDEAQIW